jgi:hypothetical protein
MTQDETPTICVHMMLERINEDEQKAVLDINGHGKLVPSFKCSGCGALFYAITSSGEPKKPKVI